jgi:hypothetical protein
MKKICIEEIRKEDCKLLISTYKSIIPETINERVLFYYKDNEKNCKLDLTFKQFLFNLILLKPFIERGLTINSEYFLLDSENFNKDTFNNHLNFLIDELKLKGIAIPDIKEEIKFIIEEMVSLSFISSKIYGITINLYSIISEMNKLPDKERQEFINLIDYKIDENLPISKSEEELEKATKRFIGLLKKMDTCLTPYLKSKTGLNLKQLRECFISVGYTPDLLGNVISTPINTNYITGLRNMSDYYNNSIGTRKALLTNYKAVKASGYLTRKLSLLCIDRLFDHDVEDCNSQHLIECNVVNQQVLEMLNGRYYLLDENSPLSLITSKDTGLIGKKIYLRSPITCTCSIHSKVCHKCYGTLYDVNKTFNPGLLAVLHLTNQFTQNLLSTKHLLKISTAELEWPEIQKYFNILKTSLQVNKSIQFELQIWKENLRYNISENLIVSEISIKTNNNIITYQLPVEIHIPDRFYKQLDELDDDDFLSIDNQELPDSLKFGIENKEFSKSLMEIKSLLESKDHVIGSSDVEAIFNKFIELLLESKIVINSVHIEMILSELLRTVDGDRVDFSQENLPELKVDVISNAILNGPLSKSISFEKLSIQMRSEGFYQKSGKSVFDIFY